MRDGQTFAPMLPVQARLQPGRSGAPDLGPKMPRRLWNREACQLANAMLGPGLRKGEAIAALTAWGDSERKRRGQL